MLILAAVPVEAQFVAPCGSPANCVLVGNPDGGSVQLSGNVNASSKLIYQATTLADAGPGPTLSWRVPVVSPAQSNTPLLILGGQSSVGDGGADIVIGGANSRTVDGQPLVSFVSGATSVASIDVDGVLTAGGLSLTSRNYGSLPCDGGTPTVVATINANATCVCAQGKVCTPYNDGGTPWNLQLACASASTPVSYICLP
jgi:hypothetical protein